MYEELVKDLRGCRGTLCRECRLNNSQKTCIDCMTELMEAAADAIEKLCSFIGAEDAERMAAYPPKEDT